MHSADARDGVNTAIIALLDEGDEGVSYYTEVLVKSP